ncbi:hypothetical protein NliqN6_2335 [Naganishia liquefaciens]|uniref:Protein kinase domain-containing protein n=1 Tax=Naganishia liquefaciens TaxID=104408 RepID=A0A8H3TRQ3_9TREE|nr:hypothetical protein NliqN6_2335 [Naganishia liquefaciens]
MAEYTPRSVLKHVAGWTLGPTLGKGGFGHVRQATHRATGRKVAVKILPALDFEQVITKDILLDAIEAQKEVILLKVMGAFGIKGVVGLDMVKQEGDWKYLFLPMIPKVATQLACPLPASSFIPLFRSFLVALHAMHCLGITHEDLKPGNILMSATDEPIIADFGFSSFSPQGRKMSGGGGTTEYLSPEKVAGDLYRGPPSDVHACGVLFSKWYTNSNPFIWYKGKDEEKTIEDRIYNNDARYFLPNEPGSPGELMRAMLARDPKKRWTIPEVLRHPFLNPESPATPLAQPLKLKFNNAPVLNPTIDLLEEVAFLAWQAEEWYPCQTYTRIVRHLAAPESEHRWEKRMYHALQAWKPKDPDAVGLRAGEVPQAKPKSITRLLKELSVTENQSPTTGEEETPSSRIDRKTKANAKENIPSKMAKERDVHSTANPFDVDVAAKPIRTSSASTDSATTVSPETPALNKKDDKENVAQGTTVGKKDKKMSSDVKVKQAVKKTRANAPPVIVIEDSDEEDQDFQATVEPPRRPKTIAVQPRRSPRLAGLPPEMAGLDEPIAVRRVRRTKTDNLEAN